MAPQFATLMYQIYPLENRVDALVCFPFAQIEIILPFRDKLTEAILKTVGIKVNRVQGYPLPPDSIFRFYSEKHTKSVEEFLQKGHPGFLSRLINNAEWKSYKNDEKLFYEMIDVEIETSHDFPCIVVHSRIHSEKSMSKLLQEVAKDLNVTLPRNSQLGSIRSILTSNHRFEL